MHFENERQQRFHRVDHFWFVLFTSRLIGQERGRFFPPALTGKVLFFEHVQMISNVVTGSRKQGFG